MNEYREIRSVTDWWSRLLALGSLLIASAALYFAYIQDQIPRDTNYTAQRPIDSSDSGKSGTAENLTGAQTTAPQPVADPSDLADQPERSTIDTSVPAASEPLGQVQATDSKPSTIDWSALSQQTAPKTPVEEPPAHRDSLLDELLDQPVPEARRSPSLATTHVALKPVGAREHATAMITNRGNAAALIRELKFSPMRVEETSEQASRRPAWGPSDAQQLVVTFDEMDNLATTRGRHGVYARELAASYAIEPNASAAIRVVLENKEFSGWALAGDLTLTMENGDSFTIEDAVIPFVEP